MLEVTLGQQPTLVHLRVLWRGKKAPSTTEFFDKTYTYVNPGTKRLYVEFYEIAEDFPHDNAWFRATVFYFIKKREFVTSGFF